MGHPRLEQGTCVVTMHGGYPGIVDLSLGGRRLGGHAEPRSPRYRVHRPGQGNTDAEAAGLEPRVAVRAAGTALVYEVGLRAGDRAVIELELDARLGDDGLELSLTGVRESEGWQLVHLDLDLVAAHSADPDARLALTTHGGRRIDPRTCGDGERVHRYNWVRDAYCTLSFAYTAGVSAVVELESLNDYLLSRVGPVPGGRAATLGARMVHRMEARDPALQFVVHRPSRVRIRMLPNGVPDPAGGWVKGARWAHERLRTGLRDPYRGRFVYKVFVGRPGTPAEVPFDEVLTRIRRWHHLMDGVPQVCYLVGFQHQGHDSGYPDVFTPNREAGGKTGLDRLVREARAVDAVVSFHDNYDDAYLESPAWDPDDIARDAGGELLKGGVWNGEQAYWISLPKYVRAKAPDRIRRTLEMYDIRDTYHLDVLTASVFRPDYDPRDPRDKNDDFDARKRLVDLFRERGIDVTSEGAGLPFLPTFRYFWEFPRPDAPVYPHDELIPLNAFIAHGVSCYGGSLVDRHGVVEGLLQGSFYSKDVGPGTTDQEILDAYYLLFVPLDLLRAESMVDYRESGTCRVITYGDGSRVEVDPLRLAHRVVYRGVTLVENYVCLAPGRRPHTWVLYVSPLAEIAPAGRPSRWSCPPQWAGVRAVRATELTAAGDGDARTYPLTPDGLALDAIPTGVPHRIEPAR